MDQLTTYVFISTVEPSNITGFVQQYSRIYKIHNSIDIQHSFDLASTSGACHNSPG